MARSKRRDEINPYLKEDKIKPGPGAFGSSTSLLPRGPKFGFGTSRRTDVTGNKRDNSPGPGAYKIPTCISNLEGFDRVKSDPKFKAV